jgi:enoyl-CoA hydratase
MRSMVYTSARASAAELHHFGSIHSVVRRDDLRSTAFEIATLIAAKSPTVIRAAKQSLNGIDLWDVRRSYRFEQGFTFELNLSGVADERRAAFLERPADE